MKKHDSVLYIQTQGAYVHRDGTNVVVRVEREDRFRAPIHTLGGMVCFGNVTCTPFVLSLCAEAGIGVSFLTEQGRFLVRIQGGQTGNILLRRAQHSASLDPSTRADVASILVTAKVLNTRILLQRGLRDHGTRMVSGDVERAIGLLDRQTRLLGQPRPLEDVRGLEGDAARIYFGVLNQMITNPDDAFVFKGRSKRPPLDAMNALLSFLYVLLSHDVTSACEAVGLDPQMGFLHADRPGRASLGLDLMEPLRSVIADRVALSLVNRRQVKPSGFTVQEGGAVQMDSTTRKAVLVAYQKRKEEVIKHSFLQEDMPLGLLPLVQARLFARWLRGDLDAYPPYFWK